MSGSRNKPVTLWLIDLDTVPPGLADLAVETLGERHSPTDNIDGGTSAARDRRVGRGLLKLVLAHALDCPATEPQIERSARGAPFLRDGPGFSCSRSRDLLAIAVGISPEDRIGVDVEHRIDLQTARRLAKSSLHSVEAASLPSSPEDVQDQVLELWTAKEAWSKAIGLGLDADFRASRVERVSAERIRVHGPVGGDTLWRVWSPDRGKENPRLCIVLSDHSPGGLPPRHCDVSSLMGSTGI